MKLRMPYLHPLQNEIRKHPARFKVVACGRRFGKTMMACALIFACAASGGCAWWIGPASREADIGWRKLKELAKQVPGADVLESKREIKFPSGGWLAVLSAKSQTLRGEGLDLVVIDETAYMDNLRSAWNGDLRATLSDRKGSAVLISSTNGRDYFYDLWRRGKDPEFPSWESWTATTYDNPFIDPAEVDEARRELPDWYFRQEYLAEFVTFAGKVYKSFTPESSHCVHGQPDASVYTERWGGVDFGFHNPTVVAVGGLTGDDRLDIIDGVYEQGLTTSQLGPIMLELQDRHDVFAFYADPAEPKTIQELQDMGVRVEAAPRIAGDRDRTFIRGGIVRLETRMIGDRFRMYVDCLPDEFPSEVDYYRYKDHKEGTEAPENPLKHRDHVPDALRYMNDGIDYQRGYSPTIRVV